MAKLRCWPGAIAYISWPWKVVHQHGTLVTVIRLGIEGEKCVDRGGVLCDNSGPISHGWLCDGPGSEFPCFIADDCLRPITPPPGADITETPRELSEA